MNTRDMQSALARAGFAPGPVDGVIGPRTRAAIRAFQAARGLVVDGIAGPMTRAALFPGVPEDRHPVNDLPLDMPWMIEASRLRGLREGPGGSDSPIIMSWAHALDVDATYTGDDIAWCGLFTGHCIASGLPDELLPARLLSARAWRAFGQSVMPQFGAVLVFWRGDPNGWQGHVGFCWAWDDTHFHVLGGNQGDSVSVTRIPKNRLIEARWPKSTAPRNILRRASAAGILESKGEA
jgi:uncharacterized protein (TIGR02594 family)